MGYSPPALSPEQAAEFPGQLLSGFALAWLTFRRSSPCTTKKASFQYFTAPGEQGMSEEDVLYGPERDASYKSLMWHFRRCQRAHAFDRYFDAAHNQYYESKTLPGLVLLKEWSLEQPALPGLYTGSFRSVKPEDYDEIWLVVRGLKSMPKNPVGNIYHVPLLAPSRQLWYHYLDLKKAGNWNGSTFRADFAPRYLQEMLQPEANAKLRELHEKIKTETVLCACYCTDESLCHRSLIRLIMQAMGTETGKE